jgi:hypothetical protein
LLISGPLFPSASSFSWFFTPVSWLRGQGLRVSLQTLFSGDSIMQIHATKPLFPWDELETSPTLATIREILKAIPDAPRPAISICSAMYSITW